VDFGLMAPTNLRGCSLESGHSQSNNRAPKNEQDRQGAVGAKPIGFGTATEKPKTAKTSTRR